MTDDRIDLVRAGYDRMAADYRDWAARIEDHARTRYVGELDSRLPAGSAVLDLGCGNGLPTAAQLSRRHDVLGVDISAAQLAFARDHVPGARFRQADLTAFDPGDERFDAVVALYSLTHVPRELHAALLRRVHSWLRPGGVLLATLSAHGSSDGVQEDFVGVPMFFSGHDAATGQALVTAAGFDVASAAVVGIDEPDGRAEFLWLLATA